MKIYREMSLSEFDFWSGAYDRAKYVRDHEFDMIEEELEECLGPEISETIINDLFWFEFDTIAGWLGYKDEEDFLKRRAFSPSGEIIEVEIEDENEDDENEDEDEDKDKENEDKEDEIYMEMKFWHEYWNEYLKNNH